MLKDILNGDLSALRDAIKFDKTSRTKQNMRFGVDYYNGKHDILDYKLYYVDANGCVKEEKNRSNIKICHQFHTELVDQKVQYLLAKPIEFKSNSDDDNLQVYLDEYIDEQFQEQLQELVLGAANKGYEYLYAYQSQDKLQFQVADSLGIISIINELTRATDAVVRYYDVIEESETNPNEFVTVIKAEVWTDKDVTHYKQKQNADVYILDPAQMPNPRPHILLEDNEHFYDGGSLGFVPFFRLNNNKYNTTDLQPIKSLIDDYDLMACSLSNNLQDFQDSLYVVKGYVGENLDTLMQNIKTKKVVGVDEYGGIDVKTIDIPVASRQAKLEIDKQGIYKFGMGFDSNQIGDGNVTNIVIKSRYSLLDLKTNKIEIKLKALLKEVLNIIIGDINKRYSGAFVPSDVDICIEKNMLFNETDKATVQKTEQETIQIQINNILLSTMLSDETKLRMICDIFDLDYDEEKKKIDSQTIYADINALSNQMMQQKTGQTTEPTTTPVN